MNRQVRRRFATALAFVTVVAVSGVATAEPPQPPDPPVTGPARAYAITGSEDVRTTEPEALAAAVVQDRPVEVAAFRSERREVFVNPDGTMTAREHAQPVRTIQNGRWQPVDATLVRAPDGSVRPRAAVISLALSGGGDAPLLTAGRAGRSLSLTWPGELPAPTLEGSRATYAEVLPGVDLVVNATVTGYSHLLVVRNAEAARDARLAEVRYGLAAQGMEVRASRAGGLEMVDRAGGGAVFESGEALMWDAGSPARAFAAGTAGPREDVLAAPPESARVGKISVEASDGTLTLRPDLTMLADPATRWPVVLDPVTESTGNSGWAMVDSGYPDEEYWKFDGRRHERVAMCPENCGANSKIKRLFYALPTPYAGREILAAEFRITMVHTYDSIARGVNLYRTGGISSATNWRNQPGGEAWSGARWLDWKNPTATQPSCTPTNQNVGFNAVEAVREAAAGGWATTTFGIKTDAETNPASTKRFCDNAVLSVTYNRAPDRPARAELTSSPGGACVSGAGRSYVDTKPVLNAILRDPDHSAGHVESVKAQFRVSWPAGTGTQTHEFETGMLASGATFAYNTAGLAIPENVTVSWQVRAGDGHTWGQWSSDSGGGVCEFVYDKTTPTPPLVASPEFLTANPVDCATAVDGGWRDGVGRYGTFTFDSAATDVVEYRYGVNTNPSPTNVLRPAADGGPVSLRWLAEWEGPNFVTVQAVDRARKASAISTCHFRVSVAAPAADWTLGDAAGSATAADTRGRSPATAGAGVTFGQPGPGGPADGSVLLTGAPDSVLTTTARGVVDTSTGFAVSAWVRLDDAGRDAVAVSQSGSAEPGFTLGFDRASGRWAFTAPSSDFDNLGRWQVLGPAARPATWTHLVAVYDPDKRLMSLYVDGGTPATAQRRSVWKARGPVHIGRSQSRYGPTGGWVGGIADVAVFNRMLVAHEVADLGKLPPVRHGYWPLNEAPGDRSPEYGGGHDLSLAGGAGLYRHDPDDPFSEQALIGQGHLVLDGVDDHATTVGPMTRTDESFTVSVRVRLPAAPGGTAMTVLSQVGTRASGFIVRCSAAGRWELAMPVSDTDGAAEVRAFDDRTPPGADPSGQHLALVYNAVTNEARLYVNGELATTAVVPHASPWNAAGGLQVGRALIDGAWREPFGGVIDDVRVYAGAADATTVQRLGLPTEQPEL